MPVIITSGGTTFTTGEDRPYVQVYYIPTDADSSDSVVENPATPDDYAAGVVDYKVRPLYIDDPHIYMMGNTYPGDADIPAVLPYSVSFVQLASKTLFWAVDWTAARWRNKPPIPNPVLDTDSLWVYMGRRMEPGMTSQGPDGVSLLYRISGTYFYGHRNPVGDAIEYMNFAAAPWLDNTISYVQDRTIDESMYTNNIINITDNA